MKALYVPEGDGVMVHRLMPVAGLRNFDPFVLCDHFAINEQAGGFPDHPHRGFEAITYMLAGGMQHTDNLGHQSTVLQGGLQRFTAGKGMVHAEMPKGRAVGIQLWINLPQSLKRMPPSYQQVDAADVEVSTSAGVSVRTLVGEGSKTQLQTPVLYLDIQLEAGAKHEQALPPGFRGFVYVIAGSIQLEKASLLQHEAALIEHQTNLNIQANTPSHLILCLGKPHGEPIHQHGPFVD